MEGEKGKGKGRLEAYLLRIVPPQVEDDALEGAEGVAHVEAEADALAEQELAREDLLGRRVRQLIREPAAVSTAPVPCYLALLAVSPPTRRPPTYDQRTPGTTHFDSLS